MPVSDRPKSLFVYLALAKRQGHGQDGDVRRGIRLCHPYHHAGHAQSLPACVSSSRPRGLCGAFSRSRPGLAMAATVPGFGAIVRAFRLRMAPGRRSSNHAAAGLRRRRTHVAAVPRRRSLAGGVPGFGPRLAASRVPTPGALYGGRWRVSATRPSGRASAWNGEARAGSDGGQWASISKRARRAGWHGDSYPGVRSCLSACPRPCTGSGGRAGPSACARCCARAGTSTCASSFTGSRG